MARRGRKPKIEEAVGSLAEAMERGGLGVRQRSCRRWTSEIEGGSCPSADGYRTPWRLRRKRCRREAFVAMSRAENWLAEFSKLCVDRDPATQAMRATPTVRRVPRMTIELLSHLGILQRQDRTRVIYSKAVTADHPIYRKTRLFGQTQFTLLGTEG
jgi:hypothetical protein